jgi:hypothetical protein
MMFVEHLLLRFPITLDRDAWYFGSSTMVLIVLAALATYGCVTAVGSGRIDRSRLRPLDASPRVKAIAS